MGLYFALAKKDTKYVKEYAEKLVANSGKLDFEAATILLGLLDAYPLDVETILPWLILLVNEKIPGIKGQVYHRLFFIFKDRTVEEKLEIFKIIKESFRTGISKGDLDMLNFLIGSFAEWGINGDNAVEIKKEIIKILKDLDDFDHATNELLEFAIDGDLDVFLDFLEYRLEKAKNLGFALKFDPVPHEGFFCCKNILKNYEDFIKLIDKVIEWRKKDIVFYIIIEEIFKGVENRRDDEHGNYFLYCINEKIEKGDKESISEIFMLTEFAKFNQELADVFLKILPAAKKVGLLEEAKDCFYRKVFNDGYSSTLGEAPPALVAKVKLLEQMKDKATDYEVKAVVDAAIKSLEADIKRHVDEGEEIKNPKY